MFYNKSTKYCQVMFTTELILLIEFKNPNENLEGTGGEIVN